MADQNDPRPHGVGGTPVPDLIERYRLRRDAWIAQADELARLRDEVRGAAEREAMEIVTAARRDVRQVIMEARRELLVLSAQVQAALGEVSGKPDPAALLSRGTSHVGAGPGAPALNQISAEHATDIFVPAAAVKTMLDEARADMEALAEDARTVPFQAATLSPPPPPEPELPELPPPVVFESLAALAPPPPTPSHATSRVLLSSPFPSESVPVPPGRSVRAFVALFVAAGVIVLGGSFWWLRGHNAAASASEISTRPEPAKAAASSGAAPASAAIASPVVPAKQTAPSRLSLVVEARRETWIRTTLDGESDEGRTYAAGETLQLNAERGIALRVGNAGAVYVSVNKGNSMPLGRDGQVMTRQFVAETPSLPTSVIASLPAPVPAAPGPPKPPVASPSVPTPTASVSPRTPAAPVPLVQQAPAAAPSTAAVAPNTTAAAPIAVPAVGRNDAPSVPLPRTESTTVPPPAAAAAPAASSYTSPASAVVAAARQWLDAYHRQERSAMAALSTDNLQLADERRADERFPSSVDVNRSLDRVSVQIAADTAVLTAVMTEKGDAGAQRVSPISQVWVLSAGQWRVRQVRLVSEARLNQIFR